MHRFRFAKQPQPNAEAVEADCPRRASGVATTATALYYSRPLLFFKSVFLFASLMDRDVARKRAHQEADADRSTLRAKTKQEPDVAPAVDAKPRPPPGSPSPPPLVPRSGSRTVSPMKPESPPPEPDSADAPSPRRSPIPQIDPNPFHDAASADGYLWRRTRTLRHKYTRVIQGHRLRNSIRVAVISLRWWIGGVLLL